MGVEQRGKAAVLIATQVFQSLARREAEAFNLSGFPIITVQHPLATLPDEEIRRIGAGLVDEVVVTLTSQPGGAS